MTSLSAHDQRRYIVCVHIFFFHSCAFNSRVHTLSFVKDRRISQNIEKAYYLLVPTYEVRRSCVNCCDTNLRAHLIPFSIHLHLLAYSFTFINGCVSNQFVRVICTMVLVLVRVKKKIKNIIGSGLEQWHIEATTRWIKIHALTHTDIKNHNK